MKVTVKAAKTGSSKKNFVLGLPNSQKVFLWGSDASVLFKFGIPFSYENYEVFQGGFGLGFVFLSSCRAVFTGYWHERDTTRCSLSKYGYRCFN